MQGRKRREASSGDGLHRATACLVLALVALGITSAFAQSPTWRPPTDHPLSPYTTAQVGGTRAAAEMRSEAYQQQLERTAERQREQERERAEWRRSEEAGKERLASRARYRGQSPEDARELLRAEHGEALDAFDWAPSELLNDGLIVRYLNDFSARIKTKAGDVQLLDSTSALRMENAAGEKVPVDLSLEELPEGALRPRQAPAATALPARADRTFGLGASDVGVALAGAAGVPPVVTGAHDAVYANAFTDTDVIAKPLVTGLEIFVHVRSTQAPEAIPLGFSLPDGARLEDGDGGIDVVQAGRRLGTLHDPQAVDAQGERVPVEYALEGDQVTLRVEHRAKDFAYPLLVDPLYENWVLNAPGDYLGGWYFNRHLDGLDHWQWMESNPSYYPSSKSCVENYGCKGTTAPYPGLYIYTFSPSAYPTNSWGEWYYTVPGSTTFISRVEYHKWYLENRGNPPMEAFMGIWGRGGIFVGLFTTQSETDHAVTTVQPHTSATDGHIAVFGMKAPSSVTRYQVSSVYLGGAHITLEDPEAPPVPTVGSGEPPTGWVDAHSGTVNVTATDPGLGVQVIRDYLPGTGERQRVAACSGLKSSPCPVSWTQAYGYSTGSWNEGYRTMEWDAVDPVLHSSGRLVRTVKVDHTAPSFTLAGLNTRRAVGAGLHPLTVNVKDRPDGSTLPVSGARRATVDVDGINEKTFQTSVCSENCTLTGTHQFDGSAPLPPAGEDTFTDTSGKTLQTHTPQRGGPWVKHPSTTGEAIVNAAGRARRSTSNQVLYTLSAVPESADYDVAADLYVASIDAKTKGDETSLIARADPATRNYYEARFTFDAAKGRWCLYRVSPTSANELGCAAPAESQYLPGETHRAVFRLRGTRLALVVDGRELFSATDSSLTAAGRAGLKFGPDYGMDFGDAFGGHFDNLNVQAVLGTTRYAEGRHQVVVDAFDGVGLSPADQQFPIIVDRTKPVITAVGGPLRTQPRIKRGVHDLNITATDEAPPGLAWPDLAGIGRIEVWTKPAGTSTWSREHSNAPTSPTQSHPTTYKFDTATHPDGKWDIEVRAYDAAANEATRVTFQVDVDANGPQLSITGGIRDPLGSDRAMHISALDRPNGVRRIRAWLNPGARAPGQPPPGQPFIDRNCEFVPKELECTSDYVAGTVAEGTYKVLVITEDRFRDVADPNSLGNMNEQEWDVHVVNTRATDRTKLGLEHYFHYDVTDAGGNSTVAVNGDGGNTVWHSVPVVNPGRGLSTVVNLTYNSHERGGLVGDIYHRNPVIDSTAPALGDLAGFTYGEAGVGFSIAVSGPTRLNEPLDGVLTAQTLDEDGDPSTAPTPITMTDADGTLHTFTNRSPNYWRDTDGMNLHLRQFKPGGGLLSPIADKWAMTRSDGVTHFFDSHGYLTKTVDRNTNALTYTYENVNAFTGGACPTGSVIGKYVPATPSLSAVLCYPRVVRVRDPAGRNLTIEYGHPTGVLDAVGTNYTPQFPTSYPALVGGRAGRISAIVDHAGRRLQFTYSSAGLLEVLREAAGTPDERATKFVYDDGGPSCGVVPSRRRARQMCRVVELRDGADANATIEPTEEHATTAVNHQDTSCNARGGFSPPRQANDLLTRRGANGQKDFQYTCNATGDTFRVVQRLLAGPVQATFTAQLDATGRPDVITDPVNRRTNLDWDTAENKVTQIVEAEGGDAATTVFDYDTANGTGVLESKTERGEAADPNDDRTTVFGHQFSLGRHQAPGDSGKAFVADLNSVQPPKAGTGWRFMVESLTGNVRSRTDAKERTATTDYDSVGRIIKETPEPILGGPNVRPTIYGGTDGTRFHATGQPLEVTDARGGTWRYEYDAVGNPTLIADPRSQPGAFKSGDGFVTTLTYDNLDRLVREHVPKKSMPEKQFISRTRAYDRNGNVTSMIDGENAATTIEYTAMDQPSRIIAPGSNGSEITRFAHDDAERVIGVVGPRGAEGTAALVDDNQTAACSSGPVPLLAFTTRYCYDAAGRRIAEVRTSTHPEDNKSNDDESKLITSFRFDDRDNLVGIADPKRNATRTVEQAVDAARERNSRRYINVYNRFDEVIEEIERPIETQSDGSVLETVRRFGYDQNGNRTSSTNPRNQAWVTEYAFDHRDQLVSVLGPSVRFNEPSDATARPLTCIKRREDGLVVAETSPRGTANDHARCRNERTTDHYTHFTKRYAYDAGGDVLEEWIPYAPGQYYTPDGASQPSAAAWRLRYLQRDLVGNPIQIRDPRGNAFLNEFMDDGQLLRTERPSFWRMDWPEERHGAPDGGQRFRGGSTIDARIGAGGPKLVLRTDRSANAHRSDDELPKPPSLGETDFGRVYPDALPGLLPQAGWTSFTYDDEGRLEDITDARGKVRRLRYDPAGRIRTKSWPYKPATSTAAEQRIGHTFGYDEHGNLTSFRNGRLYETTFAYDGYDQVVQETAPGSRSTRDSGQLPPINDAVAEVTRFDYDLNGNLALRRTPRGAPEDAALAFQYAHDSLDRLTRETNPAGEFWEYEYDVAGNRALERRPRYVDESTETNRAQHRTSYAYDQLDRLDTITTRGPVTVRRNGAWTTDVQDIVTDRGYDLDGLVVRTSQPGALSDGHADDETADPPPRITIQTYDGRGLPWRKTEGAGLANARTTITEYDANGNLRRTVNPAASDAATPVNDTGDAAAASRDATVRTYDAHDLVTKVNLPWDGDDQRKFAQEFQRNDPLHRVTSILSPHETNDDTVARTSYTYYDSDWVASMSNEKVVKPSVQTRVRDRLVDYDYDDTGNQITWNTKNGDNANGRDIERTFWPNGLLRTRSARKVTNDVPSRRVYEYLYNRNRSLVEMIDQRDNITDAGDDRRTVVRRDDAERPTLVNEAWATTPVGRDTKFSYDKGGNVVELWTDGVDGSSGFTGSEAKKATFVYDPLNRETSMTVDPAGTEADRTTTTTHHASGERARRRKPNQTLDTWLFNGRGELVQHTRDPESGSAETDDFTYDANGNRTSDERGTHQFNARDQHTRWQRPTEEGKAKSGWSVTYELNGDGAVTKKTERNAQNEDRHVTEFDYRGERLVHTLDTDYTDPPVIKTLADYEHDDFGNVVRVKHEVESSETTVLPPAVDSDLDPEGCSTPDTTRDDITYYCYDEFSRLRFSQGQGVDKPAVIVHDGLDRRDTRQVEVNGHARTRDYSYIGLSERLARETTASGNVQSFDYDSSGERQGVDRTDKPYRPYAKDANGSVTGLENPTNGAVGEDDRYRFDPYGQLENADGEPIDSILGAGQDLPTEEGLSEEATENPFRFEGFYYDSGVKTYDMHARHYRADIGRFLTQDHYASAAGDRNLQADPLTQNRYAFASGNPVSNIEFDGHMPCPRVHDCPGYAIQANANAAHAAAGRPTADVQPTATVLTQPTGTPLLEGGALDATQLPPPPRQAELRGHLNEARKKDDGGGLSLSDAGHLLLDGAGLVPLLGEPADLLNCGWYSAEGNEIDAGLSCASAIPAAGYAATAAKGGRYADEALEGAGRSGDEAAAARSAPCSFSGATLVLMADGSKKPISQIRVGDKVIATDPQTGESRATTVLRVWEHRDTLVTLDVDGEALATTEDHPFWNETDGEWQRADELDPGDDVFTAGGRRVRVRGIDLSTPTTATAYNLDVGGASTFHVGAGAILVHNQDHGRSCASGLEAALKLSDEVASTFKNGEYTISRLEQDLVLQRWWGGSSRSPLGQYWSRTPYTSGGRAKQYLALPLGNTAENVTTIRVPAGTVIYEGKAAAQPKFGGRRGGGNQVVIPHVDPAWRIG